MEKNLEFIISNYTPFERIYVDKVRLNQIFYNLLSNSIKFTKPGGRIEMFFDDFHDLGKNISFRGVVRDNEKGMTKDFQKRMFDAFSQEDIPTNCENTGTGLGLTIVKRLVDLFHAKLTFTSKVDVGTTFYIEFVLPKIQTLDLPKEFVITKEVLKSFNKKRVLLVEDHPLNIIITEKILINLGIKVTKAMNGKEGLDCFATSSVNYFDLIIMDIRMPLLDG